MAKKSVNYASLAKTIIENVGGKENVKGLRHCVTRVRFRLIDESVAKDDVIKNLDGVLTVVKSGGEYMVVIGDAVVEVYNAICSELGMADGQLTESSNNGKSEEKSVGKFVMNIINTVVGAVAPALNLICAGGVLKGILTILTMTGMMSAESGYYILFSGVADAVFYFLPVILGLNLAKKLGEDPFIGLAIGAILCYPTLNGTSLIIFGRDVSATYTSTFLPVIVITAVAVPIAKFLRKYIPKAISGFMVPLTTLAIVIPLGFAFIGPFTSAVGNLINAGINTLLGVAPVLAGALVSGLYQVLVIFGIHSALTSFSFMNVLSGTPDAIMALCMFPSFAQIGVVLAMYLKTKDAKLKEIALPAFISGIFGVTEPAIYGVTLPHIKMFIVSCIGAATSGIIVMLSNTLMYSFTGMGIVSLLGMVNPESPNFLPVIFAAVVPFVVSFVLAFILYKDENQATVVEKEEKKEQKVEFPMTIECPIPGEVVELKEVPDETFASGLLGKGIAVNPSEGKLYAPFDGECELLADTLHAVGMKSTNGVSMLVHVGLETVGLEGKPFTPHIKAGDHFEKGQLLLEFDLKEIEEAECPTITSVLVINEDEIGKVDIEDLKIVVRRKIR